MGAYREEFADWPRFVLEDIARGVLGEELGKGSFREVFEHLFNPDLVVKIERYGTHNNKEWDLWQAVKETEHAKWFAPCVGISAYGNLLLMKRTQPIAQEMLPEKVPLFMTDLKRRNWGLLDGKPVCHDYGCNLMKEYGMTKRLKKADWTPE